ncbi:hypothetical protein OG21DRAFT_1503011 [Imleria badia]|nr:hypothetical protein OG21DRAFT_1503011 [Imleria badia]
MKLYLASLVCFAAAVVARQPSVLIFNTPVNVVECDPLVITWSGGKGVCPTFHPSFRLVTRFLELSPEEIRMETPSSPSASKPVMRTTWVVNFASA